MIEFEVWVKKTGSEDSFFFTEEKHVNIAFFGGLFLWKKFISWTVYEHDFRT